MQTRRQTDRQTHARTHVRAHPHPHTHTHTHIFSFPPPSPSPSLSPSPTILPPLLLFSLLPSLPLLPSPIFFLSLSKSGFFRLNSGNSHGFSGRFRSRCCRHRVQASCASCLPFFELLALVPAGLGGGAAGQLHHGVVADGDGGEAPRDGAHAARAQGEMHISAPVHICF